MAVKDIVPVPGDSFERTLTAASPDLLREMIRAFAQKMMDAEVEVACGAGYGEVSPSRVNSRNGYRPREWDTRAGTVELAVPKLRHGSYFPSFLEHRRRAERGRRAPGALPGHSGARAGDDRRQGLRGHGRLPGGRAEPATRQPTGEAMRCGARGFPAGPATEAPL